MPSVPPANRKRTLKRNKGSSSNKKSDQNGERGAAIPSVRKEMELEAPKQMSLSSNDNCEKSEQTAKLEVGRLQFTDENGSDQKDACIADTKEEETTLIWESKESKLFPIPLWKRILEQVEDSKEKVMLANMSMTFREALKEERTVFLFHKVFPIIHLNGYLPRKLVLTCRLVCHEWKTSIDNWIQNPVICRPAPLLELYNIIPTQFKGDRMEYHMKIESRMNVLGFLDWINSSYPPNGNPFISRNIRVGCICEHGRMLHEIFWTSVYELFVRWGQEIWTLHIQFSVINPYDSVGVYKLVSTLLKLTPNLRSLRISAVSTRALSNGTKLRECIEQTPLPQLPKLTTLRTALMPVLIVKSMLKKFAESLENVFIYGSDVRQNVYGGTLLPSLKTLYITSVQSFLRENTNTNAIWSGIETLDLHCRMVEAVGMPQLFRTLNSVGRPLRQLNLTLQRDSGPLVKLDAVQMHNLYLKLANLEQFSLTLERVNLNTMDFMLPMQSLKYLHVSYVNVIESLLENQVKVEMGPGRRDGQIIQFWKYYTRLHESNIWRFLPKLREIHMIVVYKLVGEIQQTHNNLFFPGRPFFLKKKWIFTREGYNQWEMQSRENGAVAVQVGSGAQGGGAPQPEPGSSKRGSQPQSSFGGNGKLEVAEGSSSKVQSEVGRRAAKTETKTLEASIQKLAIGTNDDARKGATSKLKFKRNQSTD